MKSITGAPRSGFLIKDGSEYHLISISFDRLLLAVHLIAQFGLNKSSGTAQNSRDKTFCTSTSRSLQLIAIARTSLRESSKKLFCYFSYEE